MNKRITSLLMILILLFSFCGCDTELKKHTNTDNSQVEITDNINKQDVDSPTEEQSNDTELPDVISNNAYMRVHFIDVGQADSTFIELGNGQTMLIDAGESHNASTIIKYIKDHE